MPIATLLKTDFTFNGTGKSAVIKQIKHIKQCHKTVSGTGKTVSGTVKRIIL